MGCNNSTLIKKAKSYVMKEKASVDDMPDILAKLIAAKSSKNVKAALKTLMEVAPNELAAQQVARAVKVIPKLQAWVVKAKDNDVKRMSLTVCSALSAFSVCAAEICTEEFLKTVQSMGRGKDKSFQKDVAKFWSQAGGDPVVRGRIFDLGVNEQIWNYVKSKDHAVAKLGMIAFAKIADDAQSAAKLVDVGARLDETVKFFFARLAKTDETDVEKWCLITIARLSLADAFSEKIARMEKLPMIFTKANDTIAGRKLPSALCIANCASNKLLRVRLVKHKAFQLFVDMSKVSSAARSDMAEYQRVAALGLKNLSASFDLRALAAKVGVLEAVVKMLRSKDLEVARYAARAASELSLHEENGRRMVLAGALKPLIDMAKSGDAYCENEACTALNAMSLSEDNQKQFMKEGGLAAIEVMTLSKNPRVKHFSTKLVSRMRLTKLRTAARFAGQMAQTQKELERKARIEKYGYDDQEIAEAAGAG